MWTRSRVTLHLSPPSPKSEGHVGGEVVMSLVKQHVCCAPPAVLSHAAQSAYAVSHRVLS